MRKYLNFKRTWIQLACISMGNDLAELTLDRSQGTWVLMSASHEINSDIRLLGKSFISSCILLPHLWNVKVGWMIPRSFLALKFPSLNQNVSKLENSLIHYSYPNLFIKCLRQVILCSFFLSSLFSLTFTLSIFLLFTTHFFLLWLLFCLYYLCFKLLVVSHSHSLNYQTLQVTMSCHIDHHYHNVGLAMWLSGKNLPANSWATGLIPGLRRSPGKGNGNTLQYSCLVTHGQRSLRGCSPWAHKELDKTEHTHTKMYCITAFHFLDELGIHVSVGVHWN